MSHNLLRYTYLLTNNDTYARFVVTSKKIPVDPF